jgi:hypothetical protein
MILRLRRDLYYICVEGSVGVQAPGIKSIFNHDVETHVNSYRTRDEDLLVLGVRMASHRIASRSAVP